MAKKATASIAETISTDTAESEERKEGSHSGKTPYFVDRLTMEAKGWGLSFGESGTQPYGNASKEELAQYDAYFLGGAKEKILYLTFDCGYENGNTEAILDALQAQDVKAAFFVVGHYLESAPELVQRMVAEGHTVGSHTYHHPDVNTLGEEEFLAEMEALQEKFTQVTGEELAMYYRPPEGNCGIENLTMAQDAGYTTVFWSLAYVDWDPKKQPSHKEALEKLTERVHPGAVVLLHNTSQTNGEILEELLIRWKDMGYEIRPLSDLAETESQGGSCEKTDILLY
ncbi:MAG: polysaccharide deacetylase family protein [Lachnospiraceae bacterium]|nr:polysaccharide deacetylase family protein [Lachnospiraceae bacterium]